MLKVLAQLLPRIGGFAVAPIIILIANLATYPAVASNYSAAGWASIAVGQSIGSTIAIVVELGWGIRGPVQVAGTDSSDPRRLFEVSLVQRFGAYAPLSVVGAVVAVFMPIDYTAPAMLAMLAAATIGLSPVWLYVGLRRAKWAVLLDATPRAAAAIVGAGFLFWGAPLAALPALQLGAGLISAVIPIKLLTRSVSDGSARALLREAWRTAPHQVAPTLARLATAAYVTLPTAIAPYLFGSTSQVASYAAADRLGRMTASAVSPFNQALQGWVPASTSRAELFARIRTTVVLSGIVGAVSGALFLLSSELLASVLFRGEVLISRSSAAAFALVIMCVVLSRATGVVCLGALGKLRVLATSTVVGAVVALPALPLAGTRWGVDGLAWAVALTEAVVLGVQAVALLKYYGEFKRGAGDRARGVAPTALN